MQIFVVPILQSFYAKQIFGLGDCGNIFNLFFRLLSLAQKTPFAQSSRRSFLFQRNLSEIKHFSRRRALVEKG